MNNFGDEMTLNKLYEDISNEKNKIMLDLKNDTEMSKRKNIESKMTTLDTIQKNVVKYRNLIIKEKLKSF